MLVDQKGIIPGIDLPLSSSSLVPAFILSGPSGRPGQYTFESKKGAGVILFEENNSCEIYYDAVVLNYRRKVFLRYFDIESLQKR